MMANVGMIANVGMMVMRTDTRNDLWSVYATAAAVGVILKVWGKQNEGLILLLLNLVLVVCI